MSNFKIVISDPKKKKAYQKEVDQKQSGFIGKKIGEHISGDFVGLPGYKLELRGGSDKQGFPMRNDVDGTSRKKLLVAFPPGYHPKIKGMRKRKSIRGNTVSEETSQVNVKIVEYGQRSVEELLGVKEKPKEEKAEEKKEEKAEKPKEDKPAEKPKEEKTKEEKPVEKKEEPKPEEKPAEKKPESAQKAEEKMGVKSLEDVEQKA
ncbi:MAG: 30S ribosomal protein S6e, partial [Nanoarchaeota archaeon]|nr:30S ribosomal protein S6e [Nanoarchaeota archaeon]